MSRPPQTREELNKASYTLYQTVRSAAAKSGTASSFKLPISNALGIDAMSSRNRLKVFALTTPSKYAETRQSVFDSVVTHFVSVIHEDIWAVLKQGVLPSGDPIMLDKTPWSPNLPDSDIGDAANSLSKSIMAALTELLEKVLPDSFSQLADNKLMNTATIA